VFGVQSEGTASLNHLSELTINTDKYLCIFNKFVRQLTPDELNYTFLEQDSVTCHMSACDLSEYTV